MQSQGSAMAYVPLESGHTIEDLTEEELTRRKDFFNPVMAPIRVRPGGWLLPKGLPTFANSYYRFQFRLTDVVVTSVPKSGSSWVQEIVWTLRNNPNLDHPDSTVPLWTKSPILEMDSMMTQKKTPLPESPAMKQFFKVCPEGDPTKGLYLQTLAATTEFRIFKTHLPFSLLPPDLLKTAKVIYVARNPKDVCVSFLHHHRLVTDQNFRGSDSDWVEFFVTDRTVFSPYWSFLREAWNQLSNPNLHFVFYEDLVSNPGEEIRKLDAFLGTKCTQEQLEKVVNYTSFDQMKGRVNIFGVDKEQEKKLFNQEVVKKTGGFFRKGQVGSWKDQLSAEDVKKLDAWINDNQKDLGIKFRYE